MTMIGRCGLAFTMLAACINGAAAQQAAPTSSSALSFELPPWADTGKPRAFAPQPDASSPGCAAVLDCRFRVIGAIQHNGAVELNTSILKW
jgi:hypothetical protein